ncbi:hypothetical protein SERLA73DRAFT_68643 [Serpula lacrymans var. lacrymans S7.3]|uniref:Uncharacterized protein n=2 Tax=Serpula lacrymans var. lacrymans TaxID=341189 RepID=F8PHE0_SERL3|nr:uncharacterized protein SERLADRAFT_404795 [Serpula lacrymans var. lacrymans S7.9]EGO04986.1 hypothetical protein SERLA73DRAFT_68643 [Serpula lacrymans var. lacrymans S7.3]EGO30776.1 hypothetical protein SERLADRAFT_404795 [Serpula lacrymans var. lacrymans S7.9]
MQRLECCLYPLPPPCAMQQAARFLRRGLETLSDGAIKKATSLKYASHERIYHNILATAWKIEEKERAISFLNQAQSDYKQSLSIADTDLEELKDHLHMHGLDAAEKDDIDPTNEESDGNDSSSEPQASSPGSL